MHKLLHIQSLRVSLCRCVKRDYLYIWHILNQFFANSEIYFCVAPGRTPYRRFVYIVRYPGMHQCFSEFLRQEQDKVNGFLLSHESEMKIHVK
jgi:hypothetical protein